MDPTTLTTAIPFPDAAARQMLEAEPVIRDESRRRTCGQHQRPHHRPANSMAAWRMIWSNCSSSPAAFSVFSRSVR